MKHLFIALVLVLGFASASSAQATTAGPTSKLVWDVTDATLAVANGSTYKGYFDSVAPVVLNHSCVTGTPVVCSATIPALTQGEHNVTVTRSALVNGATVESPKSNSVSFTMLLIQAVQNLRIEPSNP